ncbi:MAG: hypothetical protein MUE81_15810 [Thermoflexibacter sp.]|jgi:regulator of replication initiation timing|nr:hypothetical protein [Thermoflexibacter sp.]
MEPVFVIGILSSIPIVAILSNALIKIKRMELEKMDKAKQTDIELIQVVSALSKENDDLKKRLENIETIVTLGESQNSHQFQQQIPPQNNEMKKLAEGGNEIAKILMERQFKNKQR